MPLFYFELRIYVSWFLYSQINKYIIAAWNHSADSNAACEPSGISSDLKSILLLPDLNER